MKPKRINIEKVAAAIEADAEHTVPGLRESLAEAKAGIAGAVHTPEEIAAPSEAARSPAEATDRSQTVA